MRTKGTPTVWTEERRKQIVEMRKAGKTTREIAIAMNSMQSTIISIEDYYNLRTPAVRNQKKWTVGENLKLFSEYYSGLPVEDIRRRHGLKTTGAVYSRIEYLLDNGWEPRSNRNVEKRKRRRNESKIGRRSI